MVSNAKKSYMRSYNQKPEVKAKKAEYMRNFRAGQDKEAAQDLVRLFLDSGYEDLAFEYAKERAPEMLLLSKARAPKRAKQ